MKKGTWFWITQDLMVVAILVLAVTRVVDWSRESEPDQYWTCPLPQSADSDFGENWEYLGPVVFATIGEINESDGLNVGLDPRQAENLGLGHFPARIGGLDYYGPACVGNVGDEVGVRVNLQFDPIDLSHRDDAVVVSRSLAELLELGGSCCQHIIVSVDP